MGVAVYRQSQQSSVNVGISLKGQNPREMANLIMMIAVFLS